MSFKDRYLSILGLNQAHPTLEFLCALVGEQLRCFPYENISKIVMFQERGDRLPTADEYLDDQVRYGYGGTCYPQNIYFYQLLGELGLSCKLVQASINGKRGAHVLIKVYLEYCVYYVDFGFLDSFAGPFLESKPVEEMIMGRMFKFLPADDSSNASFEIWSNNDLIMKFVEESVVEDLRVLDPYVKSSFLRDQYFMNNLVIGRRWGKPCYNLVNGKALFHQNGTLHKIELDELSKIESFIHDQMNLPSFQYRDAYDFIYQMERPDS